jgi:ABC-type lipoprotein export system ATPase subunit
MIQFENVTKVYKTSHGDVRALDGIDLEVAAGEYVSVRGPSGCGKSTLLSLAGGLATPTSGKIEVAGEAIAQMPSAARARFRAEKIGFVFQLFHLLPYLDVLQNVLVATPAGKEGDSPDRAAALLTKFGLADRLTHHPSQLSAGERQRVAMARALLNGPEVLLADEPTGNLDAESAAGVLDAVDDFHRAGGTVLLVTHEDATGGRAQRTIYMRAGKLQQAADAVR